MEAAISIERYCYYRDALHRPMITVAMLVCEYGQVGYGWAICSQADRPQYGNIRLYRDLAMRHIRAEAWISGGRTLAYGRALAALARGVQIADKVWRYRRPLLRDEALQMVHDCHAQGLLGLAWHNVTTDLPTMMQPPGVPQNDNHASQV